MSTLGQKIKALRIRQGLNQGDIADKFEVSRGSVSNWELDRRVPDLKTIEKLAAFYNVGLDYFGVKNNKDDVKDYLARSVQIFNNPNVSQEDKDELYQQLMRLYLNSKDHNQ